MTNKVYEAFRKIKVRAQSLLKGITISYSFAAFIFFSNKQTTRKQEQRNVFVVIMPGCWGEPLFCYSFIDADIKMQTLN